MEITNIMLLGQFRQCAHFQFHRQKKFRGQGRILVLLKERGMMTQRELTQRLQRRSATLSEQLENMEKMGWIQRSKCASDKRNLEIKLTQLGLEMAREAEKEREEEADILFGVLENEEKEKLYAILTKLGDIWCKEGCKGEEDYPQDQGQPADKEERLL